jgi:hypothetical protein
MWSTGRQVLGTYSIGTASLTVATFEAGRHHAEDLRTIHVNERIEPVLFRTRRRPAQFLCSMCRTTSQQPRPWQTQASVRRKPMADDTPNRTRYVR